MLGRDIHWWTRYTGLDIAPIRSRLVKLPVSVLDDGTYKEALEKGGVDRREMFHRPPRTAWCGRTAPGKRSTPPSGPPATATATPELDDQHRPLRRLGVFTTVPGLGYVGIESQRSFASNSLRGATRDAEYVLTRCGAHPACDLPGAVPVDT